MVGRGGGHVAQNREVHPAGRRLASGPGQLGWRLNIIQLVRPVEHLVGGGREGYLRCSPPERCMKSRGRLVK